MLPHHDGPVTRARWTLVLTAAALLTAWSLGWIHHAWDSLRGAAVPGTTHTYEWDDTDLAGAIALTDTTGLLDGLDAPAAEARTLPVPAEALTLDLVWEPSLTITAVRLETYSDAYGTGHRLGIAADTATRHGPDCLNARLTTPAGDTTVQMCLRSDQHAPAAEYDDHWRPDHLFVTPTANLDPVDYDTATQVDYYGFGVDAGDSIESGLWGPHGWNPEHDRHCDDLDRRLRLDDLHFTGRYDDPSLSAHQRPGEPAHGTAPAHPSEGRLLTPACIPVSERSGPAPQTYHYFSAEPFQRQAATPLAGWIRYNAVTRDPQPMRTALVIDIRSCDTTADHCTADHGIDERSGNNGPGGQWMNDLLDTGIE